MKLLVIDGNSILNRAFYGIRLLSTKDGHFTNGILGFLNIFLNTLNTLEPDSVAIAFDLKGPTFRHSIYEEYKAGRKETPPELAQQFPVLKDILRALGYAVVESEGYEADDILGTLAAACGEDDECYISTGDRDTLQLVRKNVKVLYATTKQGKPLTLEYDEGLVFEEFSVTPEQMIDLKALMGDKSDNIPGVAGIGQKTASRLISEYKSLEKIYEDVDALDISNSFKDKLKKGKDDAFLSRKLGKIFTEVPIDLSFEAYKRKEVDTGEVRRILSSLEMYKTLERLNLQDGSQPQDEKTAKEAIEIVLPQEYDEIVNYYKDEKDAYFALGEKDGGILHVCFYIDNKIFVCDTGSLYFSSFWADFLSDKTIKKHTDNTKLLFSYGEKYKIKAQNIVMDITLAGYLLNPNVSDYLATSQAAHFNIDLPLLKDDGHENFDIFEPTATTAALLPDLCKRLFKELEENGQTGLLSNIEIPLAQVLASMEHVGFKVDKEGIEGFSKSLDDRINSLQKSITGHAGTDFNLQSPKQLGEVLFEKMGLPKGKKTKTGYSTSAEVLEGLIDTHPIIQEILEFRTLAKLKSTYCDGLLKVIGKDGRIHSTFNQTETRTGRISSTEPNLQNIPVRQELGRELRRFFVAKDGYVLIDADYSQIELRVLAHISGDPVMIEAFNNNEDIHTITASQVFGMPLEMVTPLMRDRAKAVNFGIIYGIGAFSLSKDIGVSRYEADEYIKAYLHHYEGVNNYMEKVIKEAKEKGYVETLYKRRRYLPELAASNAMQRAFGERVARNMPIQGTAADIIKIAMVNVFLRLQDEKLDARLILQVHDELIIESSEKDAEKVAKILKDEMENAAKLEVKLLADIETGKTWYDTKE